MPVAGSFQLPLYGYQVSPQSGYAGPLFSDIMNAQNGRREPTVGLLGAVAEIGGQLMERQRRIQEGYRLGKLAKSKASYYASLRAAVDELETSDLNPGQYGDRLKEAMREADSDSRGILEEAGGPTLGGVDPESLTPIVAEFEAFKIEQDAGFSSEVLKIQQKRMFQEGMVSTAADLTLLRMDPDYLPIFLDNMEKRRQAGALSTDFVLRATEAGKNLALIAGYDRQAKDIASTQGVAAAELWAADPNNLAQLSEEAREQFRRDFGNWAAAKNKVDELAEWGRQQTLWSFAQEEIASGRLLDVNQLKGQEYQQQFEMRYNTKLKLTLADQEKINQLLGARAEAAEKDREAYSNDLLKIVEDSLKAGDADTAQRYLQELAVKGYAVDRMGRTDPDVLRYSEQLRRLQAGGQATDFDRQANRLWGRLRDRRLTGMREQLAAFLEKFPGEQGREEHQQLLNKLEQAEKQAEERAAQRTGKSAAEQQVEYYRYFASVMDNPKVTLDELRRLDQWRWRNYPRNERNKQLPGIEQETFKLMGDRLKAKQEELGKGADLRTRELKMAEERIRAFFDPQIRQLEGNRKKGPTEQMYRLMGERDRMLLALQQAAKDPKADLMNQSVVLLSGLKTRRVKDLLKALEIPETSAPAAAAEAAEETEQQLLQNFRAFKGEPAQTGTVDGQPAFSDGRYWWIFDAGAWKFWDGKQWAIEMRALLK